MTRRAAVTVRRPGASRDPAIRTRTWRQTAGVKADAKGCIHAASTAGTLVDMAQASAWVVAPRQLMSEEVVTMAGVDTMRERIAAHPWPHGGVEVIRANRPGEKRILPAQTLSRRLRPRAQGRTQAWRQFFRN